MNRITFVYLFIVVLSVNFIKAAIPAANTDYVKFIPTKKTEPSTKVGNATKEPAWKTYVPNWKTFIPTSSPSKTTPIVKDTSTVIITDKIMTSTKAAQTTTNNTEYEPTTKPTVTIDHEVETKTPQIDLESNTTQTTPQKNTSKTSTKEIIDTKPSPTTKPISTTPAPPLALSNFTCTAKKDNFVYVTIKYRVGKDVDASKVKVYYLKSLYYSSGEGEPLAGCTYQLGTNESSVSCKLASALDYYTYKLSLVYKDLKIQLPKSFRPIQDYEKCNVESGLEVRVKEYSNTSVTVSATLSRTTTILMNHMVMFTYDELSQVSKDKCGMTGMTGFTCKVKKLEVCKSYTHCVTVQLTYLIKDTKCVKSVTAGCTPVKSTKKSFAANHSVAIILVTLCVVLALAVAFIVWWKKPFRSQRNTTETTNISYGHFKNENINISTLNTA